MPIFDRELIGDDIVDSRGKFHPSRYVPLVTGRTVVQRIRENINRHGDALWMMDLSTGKSLTYSALANRISLMCCSLRRRGFRACDTFAMLATNHIEIPLIFFAVWQAGGSCSVMDIGLLPGEIKNRIIETGSRFVVTDEPRVAVVLQSIENLDVQVFVIGQAEGCTPVERLFEEGTEEEDGEEMEFDINSPAWLAYSSGTTGKPKGIVHTHFSLSPYLQPDNKHRSELVGRKCMFTNGMIHGSGLYIFLRTTIEHQNAFTFSNPSLENLLDSIQFIKPTWVSIFPSDLAQICLHPDLAKYDLSSVETILYCGSGTLPIFERQIFEKLPNLMDLTSLYGMTEIMLLTSVQQKPKPSFKMSREDIIKRHVVGSVGQVFPFAKIKIVDVDSDKKLGAGEVGEIVGKSPFHMRGYLNNTADCITSDGWCRTGDQGYYDADGNLFVIGRYKDLIKYQSRKVYPSNIETQMMNHPAVEDVAAVGLPDDIDGELPVAFVVVKTDGVISFDHHSSRNGSLAKELIDFIKDRVADDEQLRGGIRFIDRIPRNKNGKILRRELVELLQSQ